MKKNAVRRITILFSIEMLLMLLIPCVKQLSLVTFADTFTIQGGRQGLPIVTNNESSAVPDPSLTTTDAADLEQIKQKLNAIKGNIGNTDSNVLNFQPRISGHAPSGSWTQKGTSVSNQLETEGMESQSEAPLQDKPLTELEGRDGRNSIIHGDDNVTMNYVYEGRTYETGKGVPPSELSFEPGTAPSEPSFEPRTTSYIPTEAESTGASETPESISVIIAGSAQEPGVVYWLPGSVISQGRPEIIVVIGGLAVVIFVAVLIFRKKKNSPVPAEKKE